MMKGLHREALQQHWRKAAIRLRPYLHICHLHRPVDLLLLLLPALWTINLGKESAAIAAVLLLIWAITAVRCAAWVYNDLLDARLLKEAPESFVSLGLVPARDGWRLFAALLTLATLICLWLDWQLLLWGAVALALLLGYPFIKRRTLLTQAYMGLCFAWVVPVSQAITPGINPKALWLLFTATLLWSSATTLLYAIPRQPYEQRQGIGSLVHIFGDNSGLAVMGLQSLALIALWFTGRQAGLGSGYNIVLLLALAQLPWQQWLLAHHPGSGATRVYRLNLLFGLTILLGIIAGR